MWRSLQPNQPAVTERGRTGCQTAQGVTVLPQSLNSVSLCLSILHLIFIHAWIFSFTLPTLSLSSRAMRFSWATGPCWWQRSCSCHHCLVCPLSWASTWPPSFHCAWRATSTTGMLLTSPWPDTSNLSISIWPQEMDCNMWLQGVCNWSLCSQCLCGAVNEDGGWRCPWSGCSGLGLRAEELHQSGRQCSAAGGAGCQGHT